MADSFQHVAPTFQIFKDGETVRARKLEHVVSGVQAGLADLELTVGDVHGREIALSGTPLHQASIGRAIGPMADVHPKALPQVLLGQRFASDAARGTALFPASPALAALAAATATNRVPLPGSDDGLGVGCVHDAGSTCASGCARYLGRSLTGNPLFAHAFDGWTVLGNVASGAEGIVLSNRGTMNGVAWSEALSNWTLVGPALVDDGAGQGSTIASAVPTADPVGVQCSVQLAGSGSGGSTSRDWTLSFAAKPLDGDRALVLVPLNPSLAFWEASCDARRQGDWLVIEISGPDWRRIWVRQGFDYPVSAPQVGIFIQGTRPSAADPEGICVDAVQMEAAAAPTKYARTIGWTTGHTSAAASITRTVATVPGRTYRFVADVRCPDGLALTVDGVPVAVPADSGILVADFVAASGSHAFGIGFVAPDIYVPLSGVVASLAVADGPCHALDCSGFSAHAAPRRYKVVPPTVSLSGALFGSAYRFPDFFGLAPSGSLPDCVAGLYDADANRMVPDGPTAWTVADSGNAVVMAYDGALLGRTFTTVGIHASGENLLAWSDRPELWDLVSLAAVDGRLPGPDGDLTAWRASALSGSLVQNVPSGLLAGTVATLALWARAPLGYGAVSLSVGQGNVLAASGLPIDRAWRRYALNVSGINYLSGADLAVEIDVDGTVEVSSPVLAHGTAVPDYVRTAAAPLRAYRRRLELAFAPAPGRLYAAVDGGLPLPGTLSGTVMTLDADATVREDDRGNAVRVDFYKDSAGPKYALVQTPVPLARAVGTLAEAFVEHVAAGDRHFRRDQVCAAIVDPGRWCRSDASRIEIDISSNDVVEGSLVTVNARACGLVPTDLKAVSLDWGDGATAAVEASGTSFGPFQHAYSLPGGNRAVKHTIVLTAEDRGLGVSVAGTADVVVHSKPKAVQAAGALLVAVRAAAQSAKAILKQ